MNTESLPTGGPRPVVRLGKYEVITHIAAGGMGAVYRAVDTENNREVALKVLSPDLAEKPAVVERFRREARHASRLRHPNIVRLYEFCEVNGLYLLAMEFVDGIDLHEYVNREGPLNPEEAREILLEATRAVSHAFEQNIVHRDIKPANFLLTWDEGCPHVKLTDMGLAHDPDLDEMRLTRAGTTVGTLDYMAPEQARDSASADVRSDLYSLGATWYHLLTGQAPFPQGKQADRLRHLLHRDPPDARRLNPQVSNQTWEVMSKLLAKDPAARHQTPDELILDLLALEGCAAVLPDQEESLPVPGKKQRANDTVCEEPASTSENRAPDRVLLAVLIAAALAFVAAGVLMAVVVLKDRKRSSQPEAAPIVVPADSGR